MLRVRLLVEVQQDGLLCCSCEGAFNDALRHYVETGTATDAHQAVAGLKTMNELRGVFDESAKELDR